MTRSSPSRPVLPITELARETSPKHSLYMGQSNITTIVKLQAFDTGLSAQPGQAADPLSLRVHLRLYSDVRTTGRVFFMTELVTTELQFFMTWWVYLWPSP